MESGFRSNIKKYLQDHDCEISTSETVSGAERLLKNDSFDIILCSQNIFYGGQRPLQLVLDASEYSSTVLLIQQEGQTLPDGPLNKHIGGTFKRTTLSKKALLEAIQNAGQGDVSGRFSGHLEEIELVDYIQLLAVKKMTKGVAVEGDDGKGAVIFHNGKPIYAKYEHLYGDLAFKALLSLENGKIIDRKLKKIPPANISRSLEDLLLESRQALKNSQGQQDVIDHENEYFAESSSWSEEDPAISNSEMNSTGRRFTFPVLLGLLLLVGVGSFGVYWMKFMQPQPAPVIVRHNAELERPGENGTNPPAINLKKAASAGPAIQEIPSQPITSEKETETERSPKKGEVPFSYNGKAVGQVTDAIPAEPKIILRLHGSNTIGSKLAVHLATEYLKKIHHAMEVGIIPGEAAVEKTVVGKTLNGLLGIEIHAHGSSTAFKDLKAKKCDVGMASRRIKAQEVENLRETGDMTSPAAEHILALDGIAVVINARNPVNTLSLREIGDIFSGKVTDWSQVGEGKLQGPIQVYARDDKSGTYDTFKGIVLKKSPLVKTAKRFESNPELSDRVAKDELGIGFTGLPYIRQAKAVSVSDQGTEPVFPSFFTVATEDYPLARRLYLYLPEVSENTRAAEFIDFSLGLSGQHVVSESGFVDLEVRAFASRRDRGVQPTENPHVLNRYFDEIEGKKRLSLNFRFNPGSTQLDNRSRRDLGRIVEYLTDHSFTAIALIGFADSHGAYAFNEKLALARANVVGNELKSRGIPVASIISASEELPIASNISELGREKNRRVEIWVGGDQEKEVAEVKTKKHEPVSEKEHEIILRLHGSNTIGSRLAVRLATRYLKQIRHGRNVRILPGTVKVEKTVVAETDNGVIGIEIYAHGSSTGFKDLKRGTCDIGMASRKIKPEEVELLQDIGDMTSEAAEHVLALDGIAVIINKSNPLKGLNIKDIAAIFGGEITDWSQIGNGEMKGPINVYARDDKSGTYDTFKGIVLKNAPLVRTARRFESNPVLSDAVARDKQGIGFTGLPYIRQAKAIAVADEGTASIFPSFFTVATEDYPLARRLYLYLPESSENTSAAEFVDFSLGTSGQIAVNETGFVDLAIRPFVANIDRESVTAGNQHIIDQYFKEIAGKKRLSLNFRFKSSKNELDNRSLRDLNRIVEFLRKQPSGAISLVGFTDSRGEYSFNERLALSRAQRVADKLKSRGIPVETVMSGAEEMPVASNSTEHGRKMNRRVEVWVSSS